MPVPFAWAVLGFVRRELELVQRTYFNRTPIARDDSVSTSEDVAAMTLTPLANDTDDDSLTITQFTQGKYGAVSVSTVDGKSLVYTPNLEAQKLKGGQIVTDTFTYTVSDEGSAPHLHGFLGLFSRGHTDTATVTVTLTGVNDAPTVAGGSATVAEDEVLAGRLPTGADVDGDAVFYSIKTVPASGTITTFNTSTGEYTYKPNANFNGVDSFTFVANDGSVDSAAATITVTVSSVDDAPKAVNDILEINENAGPAAINVLANDTDVERDSLTITAVTQPVGAPASGTPPLGTVSFSGSAVTYTPNAAALALNAGQTAQDSFTYTISDGNGGTATGTVTVTVKGVNDNVVVSTGTHTPVDIMIGLEGDWGVIRNADGTFTQVDYDADRGWVVGADYEADIDAGAFDVAKGLVYAYSNDDGSLTIIDRETGSVIDRASDARTGVTYHFDDVTDVAIDRRVESEPAADQVDLAYVVERDGTLSVVDIRTRTVVRTVETTRVPPVTERIAVDASAVSASPRLAVAKGGATVYVASGNRIAVVKRQTAVALRSAADATALDAGVLVYDDSLDFNLEAGSEITALEASKDGTRLYATVVSTDASGGAVSRMQEITVAADGSLTRGTSVVVGTGARSLAINDELNRAYVVSDRDVSVVGLGDLNVIRRVDTGAAAGVVAVAPQRDTILVTNPDAHAVSVVTDSPITIELDWGAVPRDLDAHLIGPSATTANETFHVSYVNPSYTVGSEPAAFLNVDDQDGNGPEVIQIDTRTEGTYLFYVHNFVNEAAFTGNTTVRVRDVRSGINIVYELSSDTDTDTDTGVYWHVFTLTVSASGTVTVSQVDSNIIDNDDPATSTVEVDPDRAM